VSRYSNSGAADKLEGQIERVRSTAIKIEAFRENQVYYYFLKCDVSI
jgi:hypothetical protein